jgi:hypothetical protein
VGLDSHFVYSTCVSSLFVLSCSFASSAASGVIPPIAKEFGLSQIENTLSISLFVGEPLHSSARLHCGPTTNSWLLRRPSCMGSAVRAIWSSSDIHNWLFLLHSLPNRMCCGTKRRGAPGTPILQRMLCCMPSHKLRSNPSRHVRPPPGSLFSPLTEPDLLL